MRLLTALLFTASAAAQITTPIRNKISAGDLPSAESILEVHERDKGRDAHYLDGLVWVTRGAVLLGAWDRAADLQAQVLAHRNGRKPAVAYLDAELARFSQPIGLRSRLYKRRNQLALVGSAAPPLVVEESLSPNPPTLASLRGTPVLIFGWV